jgi:hypothetical protein
MRSACVAGEYCKGRLLRRAVVFSCVGFQPLRANGRSILASVHSQEWLCYRSFSASRVQRPQHRQERLCDGERLCYSGQALGSGRKSDDLGVELVEVERPQAAIGCHV